MKFNVGDKVRIKSIQWYNENKNDKGEVVTTQGSTFYKRMARFCGDSRVIKAVYGTFYLLENDTFSDNWNDDMIEGIFKTPKTQEEINNYLSKISIKDANNLLSIEKRLKDDNLVLPDSILINKSSGISSSEFIEWYKYFEYPKTYEECCKVLGSDPSKIIVPSNHKDIIHEEYKHCYEMHNLYQLLICRDAYWKIAGEQLGLGKPWEPNYDSGINKYGIICMDGAVQKSNPATYWERHLNKILDFPTLEMRDAFYENFKELIETCKELL